MSWTAAAFKARYPEFNPASDAVVTAALADAVPYIDPGLFSTDTDQAVGLKAAHILAISPFGQNARLVAEDGSTTYAKALEPLVRARAGGPWIAGQLQ
jgi:hypothetical protein